MFISIIIPTYNRNDTLCKTISNILLFEHQFNELIIVDQTKEHEPKTKIFLNSLINKKNIKYFFVENPNLPNARNVGINNSTGEIIIFFDDDVEINENTIPSHLSCFSKPEVGCVTGKVIIINTNKNQNIVLGNSGNTKKTIKTFLFFFLRKKVSYVGRFGILSNFSSDKILLSDTCIGCNMSFKKDVLLKCGLFDSNYTGNAVREDTDISVRIRKFGYSILYHPDASIIHFMDNTGGTRSVLNENYWYKIFKNQCYFYLKNFNYSYLYIFFLHINDFLRCKKLKLKALPIFNKSYSEANNIYKNKSYEQ